MRFVIAFFGGLLIALGVVLVSLTLLVSTGVVDTGDAVNDMIGAAVYSLIIGFFAWILAAVVVYKSLGKEEAEEDSS